MDPRSVSNEVFSAVKDVFSKDDNPPPTYSVPGTSAFPLASDPQSSLVFHPPQHPQKPPSTHLDELSPGAADSSITQLPTPLAIPSTPPLPPSTTPDQPSSFLFRNKAFSALRRGSLMPTSSPSAISQHARRGSDPNSSDLGRIPTPRFTMSITEAAAAVSAPHGSPGPSRGRDKEVMEMTGVAFKNGNLLANSKGRLGPAQDSPVRRNRVEPSQEDMAMAKWRKWIIEQPIQTVPAETSPVRSRKGSPAQPSPPIPMVPLAPTSPFAASVTSSAFHSPRSPLATRKPPSRANSDESRSTGSARSPLAQIRTGRVEQGSFEIYATDTVRALQDVELAVDENLLTRAAQRAQSQPRRMSTNPRVSDIENPFIDLAARLSSRRVRPLVIELIQALGHYVDAIWSITYPQRACPWIIPPPPIVPDRRPSVSHRMASADSLNADQKWGSRMITAVQEGKRSGHVTDPPTLKDVGFWEEEVRHALRDVDDVVGIYKGVGWAFNTAMNAGQYGEVHTGNVLAKDGQGGNYARLLNDLEEAMWGDAPPRPTDLAYDLPIDFDPYAIPDSADLSQSGQGGGSMAAFFSDGNGHYSHPPPPAHTVHASPIPEEIYTVALPDLHKDSNDETRSESSAPPLSPVEASARHPRVSGDTPYALNLDAFRIDGQELSLEEIGKRRHQEWLQSRGSEGVW